MVSDETKVIAAVATTRRLLLLRWALAGIVVPATLGGLSWLCFEARIGTLFDALANLAMFAAPLWPFVLKAFQGRDPHGVQTFVIAAAVVAFNALLYVAVGTLHWRLREQPQVNRMLWLTVVVGVGFSVLKFLALVLAFASG